MAIKIYSFIFVMWILMLSGGGLVVVFVGPITFATDVEPTITSAVKVLLALFLIFIWVFILTKLKNWVFKTEVKS